MKKEKPIRDGFMNLRYDQMNDAERSEMLRRAIVGVTGLVDEATGYQKVRPKNDLLNLYAGKKP